MDDFGFGENSTPLGTLVLVCTLLSGVSMVVFGISSDKFSRKWICFGGSLVYCSFSILSFFTPGGIDGYWFFFAARALNGIGIGCVVPTIFSLLGDLVKPADRSKALSLFSNIQLFGQAFGMLLASVAYESTGSWRLPFLIIGLGNLFCTALIPVVKEPQRGRTEDFIADLVAQGKVYSYTIRRKDLRAIIERKSNIWLVVNFVDTVPTGIILFLLFRYMEDIHNLGKVATTSVLVSVIVGGILGISFFGVLSDRAYKKRKKARAMFAFWGAVLPIPFILAAFLIPFRVPSGVQIEDVFAIPELALFVVLLFTGLFLNGAVGGNWYSTLMDVNLPEHRGTIIATASFFDILGRALGPFIGSLFDSAFGPQIGIMSSVFFWIILPFFWIGVLRHVERDMVFVRNTLQARGQALGSSPELAGNSETHEGR